MELPGTTYLFNLSLLAMTFGTVSALVMLLRQTMGGQLSNFDIYLITAYISLAFVLALDAILPPLFFLFDLPAPVLWAISSGLAALLLTVVVAVVVNLRRKASTVPISGAVLLTFASHGVAVVLLLINATVTGVQGVGLFAGALTMSLAAVLWAFARRVSSLFGEKRGDDWDPKRG